LLEISDCRALIAATLKQLLSIDEEFNSRRRPWAVSNVEAPRTVAAQTIIGTAEIKACKEVTGVRRFPGFR
jgi:hypothetical protein